MRTITTCILLIISCLAFAQNTMDALVHIDAPATNLKYDWKGEVFNLDSNLCIKNCPDSMIKVQPCRFFLFDSSRTKSEIRRTYRDGYQYFVPLQNQHKGIKLNTGFDGSTSTVFLYYADRAVDTSLIGSFTWRWKVFEPSAGVYQIKAWKITYKEGGYIPYSPQQYNYDDDDN